MRLEHNGADVEYISIVGIALAFASVLTFLIPFEAASTCTLRHIRTRAPYALLFRRGTYAVVEIS